MRAVGAVGLQAISASPEKYLIFADSADEDSPVGRCLNRVQWVRSRRLPSGSSFILVSRIADNARFRARFRSLARATVSGWRTLSRNSNLRDRVGPLYSGTEAMSSKNPRKPNFGRRDFLQFAGAGLAAASAGTAAVRA